MKTPSDHLQRTQALSAADSFAVSAPAGSGKTGLLTLRVLTLLAHCEHPEEIVCITFTRKAAAEMKERIVGAIHAAAEKPRPDDPHDQLSWDLAQQVLQRDNSKQWNLLKNPQRLKIQTIDGLCRSLTLLNPLSSAIGGSTRMLDNPWEAYRQAAQLTLAAIETEESLRADLKALFLHFDNNQNTITTLLIGLLARRDQWLEPLFASRHNSAREYFEQVLEELIEETLEQLTLILLPFASDLCLLADYAGDNCISSQNDGPITQLHGITELPATDPTTLELWLSLADLLLTKGDEWRKAKGLNKNCGFPAGTDKASKAVAKEKKEAMALLLEELQPQPKLLDLLKLVRYLPPAKYQDKQWYLLDHLTRILPFCVSQLKLVFRKLNATDFSEITQGALRALGDDESPTELTLALDYQIRHILVDEFQDTATPQLQLLERLTSGWEERDGRTLFIVGDGMQSCYGFRDANVGLFLDARQSGIGNINLNALDLSVNFRSQPSIVEWVNAVFQHAFPDSDDISRGAVSFSPSQAYKAAEGKSGAETHILLDCDNRKPEAATVVALVQEALQEQSGKIAILVRTRPLLNEILPALQQAGISWNATDIDPLNSRMTTIDLLSLTAALSDASNRNAWLAILRAPWIGLDNQDLLIIAGLSNDEESLYQVRPTILSRLMQFNQLTELSSDGQKILQRAVPLLLLTWNNRRRKSLRHNIEGLWVALGGPACLLNNSDMANAEDFFTLLDRFDQGGCINNQRDFQYAVSQLYARPDSDEGCRVEVMTIHKSKGLEFETVIIPGLDKGSRSDDRQLLLWHQRINSAHQKRLLLSPLSATGDDIDPLYHFMREEQKLKNSLESTRLFYVGCTRAISRLHLIAQLASDPKADTVKNPPSGSLLASIWPSIKESAHYIKSDTNAEGDSPQQQHSLGIFRRLNPNWTVPTLIPSTLLSAYRGREYDDEENLVDDSHFRHRHLRYIGTVLHRALASVANSGPELWGDARISKQLPFWQAQLRGLGLCGQSLFDSANQVELGLRRVLGDEKGRWILDHRHKESATEASYWTKDKGQFQNCIIDRTFIDEGTRWIIDYKSSTPSQDQTLEEFLGEESATYQSQMQRYRRLFEGTDQLPVKTALYFPLLTVFLELD